MKLARLGLFTVVLMLAAQSTFAICIVCGAGDCETQSSGFHCKPTMDGCVDGTAFCPSVHVEAVAAQWTIASVEIERPSMQPKTDPDSARPVVAQLTPHKALSH